MPAQTPAVGMSRKLAAIFSTDVAGYSRLMGEDEEATIRTLIAYRDVISSLIQQYRGRVVDAPGDNLLADFASVVDAVRCAVEIQQALKVKNTELPPQRQMQFRIGINLGKVADEHFADIGSAYAVAGHYEEARAPLQRYLRRYPNILPHHLLLAAVYSELGQAAEAQAQAAEVLRLNPKFSLEVHKQRMPIKDPAVSERHIAALRKAGLK